MKRSRGAVTPERQVELWEAFVDSYTSSRTRTAVDLFLRALIGGPRRQED
ncbi:MAG TPA: hypothetical protein VNF71_12875 [Acidimicrobiales bacterium]|nr:hypothetical protein [Acidimicrobiales bacterium]